MSTFKDESTGETNVADGIYDSKGEIKNAKEIVERWRNEIMLAETTQKTWREEAQQSRDMYRSEGDSKGQKFNLHYSNVETMVPALYSSTPTPDVRKRYGEKKDKNGAERIAAQIIERNLVACLDQYDFDGVATAMVQDALIAGRGVPRVRYKPRIGERHVFSKVQSETVPWRHLVIGPCEVWEDCPWIAFKHYLNREQLIELNERMGRKINLKYTVDGVREEDAEKAPSVFKRAEVYEIWDSLERKVLWVCLDEDKPIRIDPDPLELIDFWPIPKPYYYAGTSDTMVPMVPINTVKSLIAELEELTDRIQKITKVIKWRGFADPSLGIVELEHASDGQLIPVGENILELVQSGGLEKHIWLMPIEQAVQVVIALNGQREQVKQLVFEVTGISDILRGQSDPTETLGAQEIKSNFGTMRIQHQQRMVQRTLRDLMRLKAEIMCSHFEMADLMRNAGIRLPSEVDKQMAQQQLQQAQQQGQEAQPPQIPPEIQGVLDKPSVEQIEQIIRDDMIRSYIIDVETDSTVQQDMRQVQANMAEFLNGTASFLQAVGPMVQTGFLPAEIAVDLYQPFARSFHLGKQAEDALERMSDAADKPQQPSAEQQQINEEVERVKQELEAKEAEHQRALKAKQEAHQIDLKHKEEKHQQELEHKRDMMDFDLESKVLEDERSRETKQVNDELDMAKRVREQEAPQVTNG